MKKRGRGWKKSGRRVMRRLERGCWKVSKKDEDVLERKRMARASQVLPFTSSEFLN